MALKEVLREVMAVGRDGTPSAAGSGAHTRGGGLEVGLVALPDQTAVAVSLIRAD